MADFSFFMPTRIIYGAGSIKAEAESLELGKKALIVTGRKSAKASGALDDVLAALSTDYVIFDQVENNPGVDTTVRGGKLARDSGCDFVIAIGGGSPLDAAKAIAVLAVNDVEPLSLYTDGWSNKALPIAAVPTTAGTGSEVTQYAVLTIDEEETKKGLRGPDLFPTTAFLDPKYTQSLPLDVTVDTAVDALSHLVEGYLSNRASPMSDLTAAEGLKIWGQCRTQLEQGNLTDFVRERLLLASCLGGITIAQTGTTLVHALGYPLTYFYHVPHGRANGLLMGQYLQFTHKVAPDRVNQVLTFLGLNSVDEFVHLMDRLLGHYLDELDVPSHKVEEYAAKAMKTNNIANSMGEPTAVQLAKIMEKSIIR